MAKFMGIYVFFFVISFTKAIDFIKQWYEYELLVNMFLMKLKNEHRFVITKFLKSCHYKITRLK